MSTDFNPDEFVLTKDDVNDFIDIVIGYWSRNLKARLQNLNRIAALDAMKLGLKFQHDEDFKVIWMMLLTFISELQYQNALAGMTQQGFKWAETVSKLKSDLKNGGLEKMMEKFTK